MSYGIFEKPTVEVLISEYEKLIEIKTKYFQMLNMVLFGSSNNEIERFLMAIGEIDLSEKFEAFNKNLEEVKND